MRKIAFLFLGIFFITCLSSKLLSQYDAGLAVRVDPTPTAIVDAHCYTIAGEKRCADKTIDSPRWNSIFHGRFPSIGTPGTPVRLVPFTPTTVPGTPTPIPAAWCVCCARGPNPNTGRVLITTSDSAVWGSPGFYLSDGECVKISAPATDNCGSLRIITQNPGDTARCDMQ